MAYFVGRYLLVDPIAEGRTGPVWRVWDAQRHGYVAATLSRPADAAPLLRFAREQSLRVEHPHVVAPSGWAAQDDQVLVTMDLVRGGSVADLLAEYGRLPLPYVAMLIGQLLSALAAVHGHDIVHRAVEPSNLLLEPTGTDRPALRLAGFGAAAGSPGYAAPEVASGSAPDVRQDLYAAGVVGLHLLTGEQPTPGELPVLPVRPDHLPRPIWTVLRSLTAAAPEDRPPSALMATQAWRDAIVRSEIPPIDPTDPAAVRVIDRLSPLPAGFTPDGPASTSTAAEPPPPAPAPVRPPVRLVLPPPGSDPTATDTVEPGSGPAPGRPRRRIAIVAGGAVAAVLVAVAVVVSAAGGSGRHGAEAADRSGAKPARAGGAGTPGVAVPSTASAGPGSPSPTASPTGGSSARPRRSVAPATTPTAPPPTAGPAAPAPPAPTTAAATHDDSFQVLTSGRCGEADFVDYGPGAAGGGNNDDYVVIQDRCADGHGVEAWAWLDGQSLGARYDGNGQTGAAVVWDPFPSGNVKPGQVIQLRVCLVDGASDTTPSSCTTVKHQSVDG